MKALTPKSHEATVCSPYEGPPRRCAPAFIVDDVALGWHRKERGEVGDNVVIGHVGGPVRNGEHVFIVDFAVDYPPFKSR